MEWKDRKGAKQQMAATFLPFTYAVVGAAAGRKTLENGWERKVAASC